MSSFFSSVLMRIGVFNWNILDVVRIHFVKFIHPIIYRFVLRTQFHIIPFCWGVRSLGLKKFIGVEARVINLRDGSF